MDVHSKFHKFLHVIMFGHYLPPPFDTEWAGLALSHDFLGELRKFSYKNFIGYSHGVILNPPEYGQDVMGPVFFQCFASAALDAAGRRV